MPRCPMCRGIGMVGVSATTPAYRPCPNCRGTGYISEQEAERRAQRKKKGGTALLPLIGALISTYFAATSGTTGGWIVAGIFWVAFIALAGQK